MDDLERFFRRLVENLAILDPARLHRPVALGDVFREVIPYRANRRALELVTSDEYDLLLLRLASGESGLVRTEPEEVRLRLAQELQAASPDLQLVYQFEDARLVLRREALARALGPGPERAYAPAELLDEEARYAPPVPESEPAPEVVTPLQPEAPAPTVPAPTAAAPGAAVPGTDGRCGYCGGGLPADRTVNFCPHCGQSQFVNRCPECRSDLEAGWRYCVICGYPVGDR